MTRGLGDPMFVVFEAPASVSVAGLSEASEGTLVDRHAVDDQCDVPVERGPRDLWQPVARYHHVDRTFEDVGVFLGIQLSSGVPGPGAREPRRPRELREPGPRRRVRTFEDTEPRHADER